MGVLTREHGVNTFKHFMAYKGAIMVDDEILLNSFAPLRASWARSATVHAENGDARLPPAAGDAEAAASPAPKAIRCRARPRSRARPPTAPS